eukprot:contig_5873_g1324
MVVFDDFLGVLVVLFCLCACVREYEPSRIRWVRLSTLDDVVMMFRLFAHAGRSILLTLYAVIWDVLFFCTYDLSSAC